jgi:ABC-type transport system involved in multi-copper enzyme maturation permease subunit
MFTRIAAIARNTLTELVRQKVFYIILIFALFAIGSSAFMAELKVEAQFQMIKDVCLGAMAIFTSLLAILATANFLPKDSEDRTIYTLLSKPVPRFAYLAGKLVGIIILLFLFVLIMSGVFCLVLWLREQAALAEARSVTSGDDLVLAIKSIKDATFNANLIPGILIIFVKSALLAAMTLFISTFATSALFTVMISAAVYFIGNLQATAREYWMPEGAITSGWTKIFAGLVALLFPDLQAFNLADDVIAGAAISTSLFLKTFALGWTYVAVYFLLATLVFSNREL